MVLLPDNFFHITFQVIFQKICIVFLLQQAGKKFIHIVQHVLKRLIQLFRVDQRRAEKAQPGSSVIFQGKQNCIDILNIDLGFVFLIAVESAKRFQHDSRIVGYDYIGRHGCVIIDFPEPSGPQKPSQHPGCRRFQRIQLVLQFILPDNVFFPGKMLSQNPDARLPA